MDKKVILYFPNTTETYMVAVPLNYLHLAAMLERHNIPYRMIDARVEENPEKMLLEELPNALCVGITTLTGLQIVDAIKVSKLVKESAPHVPVVWGGWHVSILPEQSLAAPYIDFVIRTQGEKPLVALVKKLQEKQTDFETIPSLCFKRDGKNILNPLAEVNDPNEFPFPAYHIVDFNKYAGRPVNKGGVYMAYQSSVGCPYDCAFCASPLVYRRRWKALTPERVVNDLEILVKKYNVTDIGFLDENFFVDAERCRKIFQGVLDRGLKFYWNASIRIEILKKLDDDLLSLLEKTNCNILHPGVEATSPDLLKVINKKFTMDDVLYCAGRLTKYHIKGLFGFIVCFPGEGDEHVETTFAMLKQLKELDPEVILPVNFYTPYPGNSLYEASKKAGFVEPKSLEDWGIFNTRQGITPWISEEKRDKVLMYDKYIIPAAIPSNVLRKKLKSWRTAWIYWPFHLAAKWHLEKGYFPFNLHWNILYPYWRFWGKYNKKLPFLHNINFRW